MSKDCEYPNCLNCTKEDCDMESKDVNAMLKRRRYRNNAEIYREKQNNYRKQKKYALPNCNECRKCILVEKEKQDGYRRLCLDRMRLIEQKVSNCPQWCRKRVPDISYVKRRDRVLQQKKEKRMMKKLEE